MSKRSESRDGFSSAIEMQDVKSIRNFNLAVLFETQHLAFLLPVDHTILNICRMYNDLINHFKNVQYF